VSRKIFGVSCAVISLTLAACQTPSFEEKPIDLATLEVKYASAAAPPAAKSIEDLINHLKLFSEASTQDDWFTQDACNGESYYEAYVPTTKTPRTKDPSGYNNLSWRWRKSAHIALSNGDFDSAMNYIRVATNLYPHDWVMGRSRTMVTEAAYSVVVGDVSTANRTYHRALSLSRGWKQYNRVEYERFKTWFTGTRPPVKGLLAFANGDYRTAELLFRQSRFLNTSLGAIEPHVLEYFLVLSLAYQGRLSEAESVARTFYMLFPADEPAKFSWHVDALSFIFLRQGRYDHAEQILQGMVNIFEETCAPMEYFIVHRLYIRLAEALVSQGRWNEALSFYQKVLSDLEGNDIDVIQNLIRSSPTYGIALIQSGRYGEGRRALIDALANARQTSGKDSPNATEIEALIAFTDTLTKISDRKFDQFQSALIRHIEAAGRYTNSAEKITAEEQRSKTLVKSYFDLLGTRSLTPKRLAASFRIAQHGQEGRVRSAMAAGAIRTSIQDPGLRELVQKQQAILNRLDEIARILSAMTSGNDQIDLSIGELYQEISVLEAARPQIFEEINRQYPAFADLLSSNPLSPGQTLNLLKTHEAAILFRVFDGYTMVWIAGSTGRSVVSFRIDVSEDELTRLVNGILNSVDPTGIHYLTDIPDFDLDGAYKLYNILFKPMEDHLAGITELLVVPDGPLRRLPFSMLVPSDPDIPRTESIPFSRYKQVDWLVKQYAITNLPALDLLHSIRGIDRQLAGKPFIGFGDPYFAKDQQQESEQDYTTRGIPIQLAVRSVPDLKHRNSAKIDVLPRLPDTANEVRSIARSLNANVETSVFTGLDASEEQVKQAKLDNYRVIAFATHGLAIGDLDGLNQPALALSNPKLTGESNDGLLTMSEILGLQMNADWIVLSACNTASSDGAGAEALSGLGRAFFFAGTETVLATGWPVETTSAAALTTTAFGYYGAGTGLDQAESLRRAKMDLITGPGRIKESKLKSFSYAHPMFWAPYELYGASSFQ